MVIRILYYKGLLQRPFFIKLLCSVYINFAANHLQCQKETIL
jgi:hypothetical protein